MVDNPRASAYKLLYWDQALSLADYLLRLKYFKRLTLFEAGLLHFWLNQGLLEGHLVVDNLLVLLGDWLLLIWGRDSPLI